MLKRFINALIVLSIIFPALFAGEEQIDGNDLRVHLGYLASPELEGREAGYPGSEIAAGYIAGQFSKYGLEYPPGLDSYYQQVPLVFMRPDLEKTEFRIISDGEEEILMVDKDVFFFPEAGDDEDITAPIILAGYGIIAPEFKYDDYEGVNVEGKVALVFNLEPQLSDENSIFNGDRMTKYSIPMIKARTAREHGAKALETLVLRQAFTAKTSAFLEVSK